MIVIFHCLIATHVQSSIIVRNLTVNIGPIRQMDLKSEKLHEILKLTDNFEIKFELRDKKDSAGKIVQEKSG